VLVTHEGWPERDRRGQGRPDIRPCPGTQITATGRARSSTDSGSTLSSAPSPRPPEPTTGTASLPGGPSTGSAPGPPRFKPDGFGRCLHLGGACEFYLEYDRGTEVFDALSRKLEGYLRLAAGWTKEQELTGFPNLLIIVPEGVREGEFGSALRHAIGSLHAERSRSQERPRVRSGCTRAVHGIEPASHERALKRVCEAPDSTDGYPCYRRAPRLMEQADADGRL
jgi:hypothetical protein